MSGVSGAYRDSPPQPNSPANAPVVFVRRVPALFSLIASVIHKGIEPIAQPALSGLLGYRGAGRAPRRGE